MFFSDERILLSPVLTTTKPFAPSSHQFVRMERAQRPNKVARIAGDFQIDRHLEFCELSRVDIHKYLFRSPGQAFVRESGNRRVETGADNEQEIRVLKSEVRATRCERSRSPDEERMSVGNEIDSQPCRQNGDSETIDEAQEFLGRPSSSNAVSCKDDWPLRSRQKLQRFADMKRCIRRSCVRLIQEPLQAHGVDGRRLNIQGNIEPNRSATPRTR